jgi:hypothetical protein
MRKYLAAAIVFIMTMPAFAGPYHPVKRGHYYNPPQHHYQPPRHRNVAPWVAGGLALGALGAYAITRPAPRHIMTCWEELIGYDRRGRPVYDEVCQ